MEKDDRLLLLDEPTTPEEILEQYHKLIRWTAAEKACAHHDDSGYSEMMARRGYNQLRKFLDKHRVTLRELLKKDDELMQMEIERFLY